MKKNGLGTILKSSENGGDERMDDKSISIYEEMIKHIKENGSRYCDLLDHAIESKPEWVPFLLDEKKLYPVILYIDSIDSRPREKENELLKKMEANANAMKKGKHPDR